MQSEQAVVPDIPLLPGVYMSGAEFGNWHPNSSESSLPSPVSSPSTSTFSAATLNANHLSDSRPYPPFEARNRSISREDEKARLGSSVLRFARRVWTENPSDDFKQLLLAELRPLVTCEQSSKTHINGEMRWTARGLGQELQSTIEAITQVIFALC